MGQSATISPTMVATPVKAVPTVSASASDVVSRTHVEGGSTSGMVARVFAGLFFVLLTS